MYPVQLMISYFTTSFTAIMYIGREVTAKQYTGEGDLQDNKDTYIQHFTTFTLPRKLTKLVYTRPALSPLDFLRIGL